MKLKVPGRPAPSGGAKAKPPRLSSPSLWKAVDAHVSRILHDDRQIVVGPWLSELGFEVLYWIPFVSWLQVRFGIPPERMVAVSRGGVGSWYEPVTPHYRELLDVFTPEEFREHTEGRWAEAGGQKQMVYGPYDHAALQRVGLDVPESGETVLHPWLMYRLFREFWRERAAINEVLERLDFRRMPPIAWPELEGRLPQGPYFAVKFYARPSFPDSIENREVVRRTIEGLAERAPVVLLDTGLRIDDHREFASRPASTRHEVVALLDGVAPERNLEAQSLAISRASAFFGTYGGFSYLAPAYGVPSFAYYSAPDHFLRPHLDVARRAARRLDSSFTIVDARQSPLLQTLGLAA
ncbi:MAG TPA: hypothetical protein VN238_04740 [Solirubrobacteraceae bacterium]|nr:hypothetical protein [Solirubrobacteraceae bacterium]